MPLRPYDLAINQFAVHNFLRSVVCSCFDVMLMIFSTVFTLFGVKSTIFHT